MRTPESRRRSAGISALELLIATAITAMLFTTLLRNLSNSLGGHRDARVQALNDERARRSVARITRLLAGTAVDELLPDPQTELGSDELSFRVAEGLGANDEILWGARMRLSFEYAEGELDDGADNNGDGLVDEGELVLVRDEGEASERRVVLCRGVREFLEGESSNAADDNGNGLVDERGLSFHRVGEVIFVRLSVEAPTVGGRLAVRTVTTAIRLMNER